MEKCICNGPQCDDVQHADLIDVTIWLLAIDEHDVFCPYADSLRVRVHDALASTGMTARQVWRQMVLSQPANA